MTTEEKYARAIRTSHMEVRRHEESPGDADTIIAAGMAEPLGVLLARLKTEWDTLSKHEIQQAANSMTARVLILMNLRSLRPAKQAMLNFALAKAESKSCDADVEALRVLVGRVMDVWLDKLCEKCEGRGFNGGYGVPKLLCTKCGASGNRRLGQLASDASQQAFGLWMLNVMDSKCTGSMKQVGRKTRRFAEQP